MLSFQHQASSAGVGQNQAQQQQQQNDAIQQQQQPTQATQQQQQQPLQPTQSQQQPQQVQQTMRLRDEPPPITPPTRSGRKRKSPPTVAEQVQTQAQPPPPPPPQQPMQHVLPPPHALMHPLQGPLPPGYAYAAPADYTPAGLPPGAIPGHPNMGQQAQQQPPSSQTSAGRTLSNSKRAEQNRKAQRAFRERRDQHVKALESRSQLLDAALASADEANRRWEECRALVDQLRIENAALRAALGAQHQMIPPSVLPPVTPAPGANGAAGNPTGPLPSTEDEKPDGTNEQGKEREEVPGGEKQE